MILRVNLNHIKIVMLQCVYDLFSSSYSPPTHSHKSFRFAHILTTASCDIILSDILKKAINEQYITAIFIVIRTYIWAPSLRNNTNVGLLVVGRPRYRALKFAFWKYLYGLRSTVTIDCKKRLHNVIWR